MPTISELPVATSVGPTDLAPIVQGGTTKQATYSLVLAYVQSTAVIPIAQVTGLSAALAAALQATNNLSDVASTATARANLGIGPLTNGQLIIGSTGLSPVLANLTAGTNIAIANSAGGITISTTGPGGFSWTAVTGATQAMTSNNGYIANHSGGVVFTLPATSLVGDELAISGVQGWTLDQNAGQQINAGSVTTTSGTGGSLASTNNHDVIYLLCTVANTQWLVTSIQGNITYV